MAGAHSRSNSTEEGDAARSRWAAAGRCREGNRTATRAALPEPDAANGGGEPKGNCDGCVAGAGGAGGQRRWDARQREGGDRTAVAETEATYLWLITNRGAECRGAVVVGAKGGGAARDALNWAHHLGEMKMPTQSRRSAAIIRDKAQHSTALQAARVIRKSKPRRRARSRGATIRE